MNVNFGLFPAIETPSRSPEGARLRGAAKAEARKRAWTARARGDLAAWMRGAGACNLGLEQASP
jgi:methylenetetrahydrofolate--tRNA-(uracil-5-)-methyltransferase